MSERAELDRLHRERQHTLALFVAARLAAELGLLADLSDDSAGRYVRAAVPVVAGGQRRAFALAAGYVAAIAPGARRRPLPVAKLQPVTADTRWMGSPIIRGRAKLAEGLEWQEAIDAASSYAGALASGDLGSAMSFGLEQGARQAGAHVRGWRKELAGSACHWCQSVAGRIYATADSVPRHQRDQCSAAPVFHEE